jgi:pyruvate formate lyase activating enzyme
LVKDSKKLKAIDWEDIKKKLVAKRKWIDGVVISGGEPMMHPEIFGLLIKIKELGFQTKIDTNGYFPYPLKEAIELGLVDYVAMDIKTALDSPRPFPQNGASKDLPTSSFSQSIKRKERGTRYDKACGRKIHLVVIERTIKLLKECSIDSEFRTTLVPGIVGPDELVAIARKIAPAHRYILQRFVPRNARLARFRAKKSYTKEEVEKFLPLIRNHVAEVTLRGF